MARNARDPEYTPAAERGRKLWQKPSLRSKAGLVGISSAAILSVYAAGYFHTEASEPPLIPAAVLSTETAATASTTGARTGGTTQVTQPAQSVPSATPTAQTAEARFVDGTYTGSGTSRHGGMAVTVTVSGGSVASVEITTCQTKYPCSKISSLPGQVVALQSASVRYVSGATDSSRAFAAAVSAALAKAAV